MTTTQRDDLFIPAWSSDQLDSAAAPEMQAPYFDPHLQAWVFSRYSDLLAAFRCPCLVPGRRDAATLDFAEEESARLKMREETREALAPARIRELREQLAGDANKLCRQLPAGEPIDLVATYGQPLCLALAAMVTGISQEDANHLEELAQTAWATTADPENADLRCPAKAANKTLRRYFHSGPEPLRDSGFVGLSQTLLRIVNAAWYALLQSPDQWSQLRESPELIDQAMEELLRYACVIRILSRTAAEDIDLNGASIRKGDHIILRVFAANHDPARFSEPEHLDCARRDAGHLTLGAGGHACVAANLLRIAAGVMTISLLTRFASASIVRPVEWIGGSIMRSPASLWVTLAGN
jgi:cytochrome P450